MADIFISYARADREIVEPVKLALEALDLKVFFDIEGLEAGEKFPDVLEREVRAAKAVLGCLSDHALTRDWVKDECRLAKELDKLTPCEVAPVTAADVPLDFKYLHREAIHPFDTRSRAWGRLLAALSKRLVAWAATHAEDRAETVEKAGRLDAAAQAVLGPRLVAAPAAASAPATPAAPARPTWLGGLFGSKPKPVDEPAPKPLARPTPSGAPHDDPMATEEFARIESSVSAEVYAEFADFFAGTPEAAEAAARRDRLREWREVNHTDAEAIAAFQRDDDFEALKRFVEEARQEAIRGAEDARQQAEDDRRRAWRTRVAARLSEEAGAVFCDPLGSGDGPEMCVMPAGSFRMGLPPDEAEREDQEGSQVDVTFAKPFALGRYAVTFDEYDAFCAATGAATPSDEGWGRGRRPVIHVSWHDAQDYCAWLSSETGARYRLPSEAEWEYACRAGTMTRYWMGDAISHDQANFEKKVGRTQIVDAYEPNPWGLFQMHGNVWEWCQDCWNTSLSGQPKNGSARESGDDSRAVLRGGSWYINPRLLRSANRGGLPRGGRDSNLGFRVARTNLE